MLIKVCLLSFCILLAFTSCTTQLKQEQQKAVLIVSHGSPSEKWRQALLNLEDDVRQDIFSIESIDFVSSAFMEFGSPSIAEKMREFDELGVTEVLVIPVFLTVSSHLAVDIPHILGIGNDAEILAALQKDSIEIYKARAKVTIAPQLDATDILAQNALRRLGKLTDNFDDTACLLVAYGDENHLAEWNNLMESIRSYLNDNAGITVSDHQWCGHLVNFESKHITESIENMLLIKDKVAVIPVLVSKDEFFQGKVIGGAVDGVQEKERVLYAFDAILPDDSIKEWIIKSAQKY